MNCDLKDKIMERCSVNVSPDTKNNIQPLFQRLYDTAKTKQLIADEIYILLLADKLGLKLT